MKKSFTLLYLEIVLAEERETGSFKVKDDENVCPNVMIYEGETFDAMQLVMDSIYPNQFVLCIFLIDNTKKIGYLYKGKGKLSEVQESMISPMLNAYKDCTTNAIVPVTLSDVRDAMRKPVFGFSQNG